MRETSNFPAPTALSVPYALLLQDDRLSHFLSHSVTVLLSPSLSLFRPHKGSLAAAGRKAGALLEQSGAQAACEITWVGCLRERVRRASATAVCRYFYQHEKERGGGQGRECGMGACGCGLGGGVGNLN